MMDRAGADRGEGQLSGLLTRELHQIGDRVHRQSGLTQHVGILAISAIGVMSLRASLGRSLEQRLGKPFIVDHRGRWWRIRR